MAGDGKKMSDLGGRPHLNNIGGGSPEVVGPRLRREGKAILFERRKKEEFLNAEIGAAFQGEKGNGQ